MNAIGHLGQDATLKYLKSGTAVLEVPLAANEVPYTSKSGETIKRVEWVTIRQYGTRAERLAEYLKKGKQVYVEGKQRTDKWVDENGVKHYRAYLLAEDIKLLGKRETNREEEHQENFQTGNDAVDEAPF